MTDFNSALNDAAWLPHHYDPQQDAVLFANIPPEERAKLAFLADFKPSSPEQVQWIASSALQHAQPETVPLHFLFHSAFCRSTLLIQALGHFETISGLSEPAICNSVQTHSSNAAIRPLLPHLLDQLSKPLKKENCIIAKPSNFANGLIPAFLQHTQGSKAILLFGSLEAFLRSVAKKGLPGRLWARKQLAHNRSIMPLDLGMDEMAHYQLSDLQCAALAWLLQMRQFSELAHAKPELFRTLDSDVFIERKSQTLRACALWFDVNLSLAETEQVANSSLFTSHAKQGGDYAAVKAQQDAAGTSQVTEEEIAKISEWIGVIMGQLKLTLPLPNSLDLRGA